MDHSPDREPGYEHPSDDCDMLVAIGKGALIAISVSIVVLIAGYCIYEMWLKDAF